MSATAIKQLSVDVTEFALRAAARPDVGAWSVLVAPLGDVEQIGDEVAREIEGLGSEEVRRLRAEAGARDLLRNLRRFPAATVVITGLDELNADGWLALDRARTSLEREGEVILVLSGQGASSMMRVAPHVASWLGGSLWTVDPAADSAAQEQRRRERLDALRAWAGMSDTDVIERAKRGDLAAEPEFAEWLVLLGRGDLLEPR